MVFASLTFSATDRLWLVAIAFVAMTLTVLWSYRARSNSRVRWLCAGLKILGISALALCLLEPLWSGQRARPGSNLFAIVADNSQSLGIKDTGESLTRAELLKALCDPQGSPWQATLEDNYEVRRFAFDLRLQARRDLGGLTFDGRGTALGAALRGLKERFAGQPLAGVLLLTDGNATDLRSAPADLTGLPPIYPVVLGNKSAVADVAIAQVTVSQSAFEDAPVSIQAEITATGLSGKSVAAELRDAAGKIIESSSLYVRKANDTLALRFQFRPEKPGVSFYQLRVGMGTEITNAPTAASGHEVTLVNNTRMIAVDRGQGPYRVLYVSGRPNWEYKFLNRALQEDNQVQLVALLRVALREAKFDFRGRGGETSNPLFRGFDNQSREDTERYDQPVLVRLNTRDELELRSGFPSTAEELFAYHAVILDDLEAAFFTADQAALLQRFVSERGGGFLMLGGMESFQQGKYLRTPVGDMLPVYLERSESGAAPGPVRLKLSREGWLQAWARLRQTEGEEKARLLAMPLFQVMNQARDVKPGASVIATATDEAGKEYPALITQRFGRGRTAAFTIGDLWRWGMLNAETHQDMDKAWRQLVRWLVADVPGQISITAEPSSEASGETIHLQVRAHNAKFQPLDEAAVTIEIQPALGPTNQATPSLRLRAEPSVTEPGLYEASYVAHGASAYLARTFATNSTGAEVGRAETGWAIDPEADEFRSLQPNTELLQEIARRTGGEVIPASKLEAFAQRVPLQAAPVMEPWTTPAWHSPTMFALALLCFVGEWGLRRWKGMP